MIVGLFLRHIKAYKGISYIPLGHQYNFISYIGENGIGKSSILEALNSFFNNKMYSMYMLQESINAGYIPTGAKVYQFKDIPDSTKHREDSLYQTQHDKYLQYIQYGRIFWITFSALIMSGLLLHYRKKRMVL